MTDDKNDADDTGDAAYISTVGNQTMQIDALVDELRSGDELSADSVLAQILADSEEAPSPAFSAPPPLPPKRVGPGVIAVGVLIVCLATAGGVLLGMSFLDTHVEPEQVPAPTATTGAEALPGANEEEATDDGDEGLFVPVQLEEVIVPHPDDELLEDHEDTYEDEESED